MNRLLRPRRVLAALAVATVAVSLAACSDSGSSSSSPGANGLTTLKVATIGLTSDGGLMTGIDKGFFADEGLKIETSIVANPPAGLAAVQSGQVDVAYSPSIPLMNALSHGVQLKVIGAADGYAPGAAEGSDPAAADDTGLFASKASGVTTVDQLKGKTIAVPARKAQLEVVIAKALKKAGIDPATGVNWVVLDFTSAVAALKSGKIDAAGLVSPFTAQAKSEGATQISAPSIGFFKDGAVGLWTSGSSTVQAKKSAIEAFQRALAKANVYANAHPQEAIKAGLAYTKSTLTPDQVTTPYWPEKVAPEDLQRVDDSMVQLGFLPKAVALDGVIVSG
jgi:NitT/TauT family transport system substrate-binding protein